MGSGVLDLVPLMAKKRNDKSAKIDAWVLFMVETVVNWKRQTDPKAEKLTVAEFLSEMVRAGVKDDFKRAGKWVAQQTGEGPKPPPGTNPED